MSTAAPKCEKCDDTGSLSKNIEGQLDCGHCDVATRRTGLNAWCARHIPRNATNSTAAWMIFRLGQGTVLADLELDD